MRRRRMVLVYGTALGVLVLDQLTKWLAVEHLRGQPPINVIGEFAQLRYTTNPGGAFSLLTGFPLFFGLMAIVIMGLIVLYSRRVTSAGVLLVLGLLLGGALGNFLDRLLRGEEFLGGEVVDFVDVGTFPVFNVADSCVTIGAITLAILLTREDLSSRRAAAEEAGPHALPLSDPDPDQQR
jgi:signal peptidase II